MAVREKTVGSAAAPLVWFFCVLGSAGGCGARAIAAPAQGSDAGPPAGHADDDFEALGPALTLGEPRTKILDAPAYTVERCLRECREGRHGECVAATFHGRGECKLFSSYTGIVASKVPGKLTFIRKRWPPPR
jgi:hypothetical protein